MSKKVCVFCGSQRGFDPDLAREAHEFGRSLALRNYELVYGGGRVGLMGIIADGALAAGGRVTGIIPRFLSTDEVARDDLTSLEFVQSLEERKRRMIEISDAFVAWPGGLGTLDELFEALTLRQLGLHTAPVFVMNSKGFYTPLEQQLKQMAEQGFFSTETLLLARFFSRSEELLEALPPSKT